MGILPHLEKSNYLNWTVSISLLSFQNSASAVISCCRVPVAMFRIDDESIWVYHTMVPIRAAGSSLLEMRHVRLRKCEAQSSAIFLAARFFKFLIRSVLIAEKSVALAKKDILIRFMETNDWW